ncbi:hypothetical protein [Paenibacillus tianjinensis]|uniref:Uncharacterized protein n=1 Tax=Paenibacillus tianjinensis TaxID=2810347 RepID=A0ABX7L857_9BACL|nr:hypothetical protein [Paenibacillus tianjinensis]QSF44349.1 hypothetical protein JRJ22_24545 [Paenibacillus tianjinensis]
MARRHAFLLTERMKFCELLYLCQLSTIIGDATYNYIIGNINAADFKKEVEKWKSSGGSLIMQEYAEAETRAGSVQ